MPDEYDDRRTGGDSRAGAGDEPRPAEDPIRDEFIDLAHANAALRDRARQQAAMATLGELAMNTQNVAPVLLAACATIVDVVGAAAAVVVEPDADGRPALRTAMGIGSIAPGTPIDVPWVRAVFGHGLRGAVVAEDAAERFGPDPFLAEHGFPSLVAALLPGRDRPGGILAAFSRTPRTFTVGEVRFLEGVASVVAAAAARYRAETDVLDRERLLRAVFDAAHDAMLVLDEAGRVVDANPAAAVLFREQRSDLLGRDLATLPGAPPDLLGRTGRQCGKWHIAIAGHPLRTVEYASTPIHLPGRTLLVLRDRTEHLQLQARLALADRMVSVGTLAAGVAHELNNPLAYVIANLAFVQDRLARLAALVAGSPEADRKLVAQLEDAIRDARDGADRMRSIVRELKTFSRPDEDTMHPVDLAGVLESCISMAWNEIRHRARLERRIEPVPPVIGGEARYGQVFLNLLVNAAQAIPEGRAGEHVITVATRRGEDGRVVVEVSDTGCGIPPELTSRIFDPFFTTKPPGVGTGLGLSICHSIVTAAGGEIEVESTVGRGTTFRVLLPAAPGVSEQREAAAPTPVPRRGRILVVDDEPLVCSVLQRTLGPEHDIVAVERARSALDLVERGEAFDVVLSDLLMPEMTGMDLHREIRRVRPDLAQRMVFLTGGAFTPAARSFLENEAVECVEKPFDLGTIRSVIARKLAGG